MTETLGLAGDWGVLTLNVIRELMCRTEELGSLYIHEEFDQQTCSRLTFDQLAMVATFLGLNCACLACVTTNSGYPSVCKGNRGPLG